ncbi:hypothetical protein HETIRDRAFT_174586 [Heterobasidion irregulare TC 32-1]|uniref:Uncharacterized protein n=1 Tax=Heterobasidion irregulare (strain TC 32-1) TaxID=747525 RepID=W4JSI8_HETIT|nr:uncharacterized protein HETIRDRAFT_174586 [Heterobasidion irregulare TC 32-1]ETW76508.1 hypothetical protein HETIRDRAFT_174586 [Heterobasidion irregulare TC 32-1]
MTYPLSHSLPLTAHLHQGHTCTIHRPQLETILAAASADHPFLLLRNLLTFIQSLQNATLNNSSLLPQSMVLDQNVPLLINYF